MARMIDDPTGAQHVKPDATGNRARKLSHCTVGVDLQADEPKLSPPDIRSRVVSGASLKDEARPRCFNLLSKTWASSVRYLTEVERPSRSTLSGVPGPVITAIIAQRCDSAPSNG